MVPLITDDPSLTVLLSVAIPVLVTGLISMINKLVEIVASRRAVRKSMESSDHQNKKTDAESQSIEADIFTKAVEGQGTIVNQLLEENRRAYGRVKDAEDQATAAKKTADDAKAEASQARNQIEDLQRQIKDLRRDHDTLQANVEGYFLEHKIPFPRWWPKHRMKDGGEWS